MKHVKIPLHSAEKNEFCGQIPRLNSAAKTQIPRIDAKFCGPRKTMGPSHNCGEVLSFRKCQHVLFLHYPVQLIVLSKPTTSRILQTKKSLADGRILDLYCYDNVEQLNFRNIWTSVCVSLRNQVYYCNCNNKFR